MARLPINIEQYLFSESTRQYAPLRPMIAAYTRTNDYDGELCELFILSLANCFGFDGYRKTPVTFDSGNIATNAHNIPGAMKRLISHVPVCAEFDDWYTWIKSFLKIHPFQDGNGRIASLLFNWGMNTLNEPVPLPYYEF